MRAVLATYNVHGCVGRDRACDPSRIVQILRELDADLVALQEVESTMEGGWRFLDYVSRETGMTAVAGPTLERSRGHYGNALLTHARVIDVRRIDLSHPRREPRGALDVDLRLDGRDVQVVITHLGLQPWERRLQIKQLLNLFPHNPEKPTALMGDFNEWLAWGRPLRWIHGYFGAAPSPATFPANFPLFALDRIWVHPPEALVRLEVHHTRYSRRASDHLPLRAVVEW